MPDSIVNFHGCIVCYFPRVSRTIIGITSNKHIHVSESQDH